MLDYYSTDKVVQGKCLRFHHIISKDPTKFPKKITVFYAQYADSKLLPIYNFTFCHNIAHNANVVPHINCGNDINHAFVLCSK